jgi:type IV pilus assembly protein PilP
MKKQDGWAPLAILALMIMLAGLFSAEAYAPAGASPVKGDINPATAQKPASPMLPVNPPRLETKGVPALQHGKQSIFGLPQSLMAASATPTFNYSVQGKVDPFVPFVNLGLAETKQPKKKELLRTISPLQLYPIEQYTLVGIAESKRSSTAIVKDFLGKFYPLSVGTIIGMEKGRVIQITANKVLVEEKVKRGKETTSKITYMTFHSEEEEGKP